MSANSVLRVLALCAVAVTPLSPCFAADPPPTVRTTEQAEVGPAGQISREQQLQKRLEQQQRVVPLLPNTAGMPATYDILTEAVTADLQRLYVVSNGAVDQNGNPGTYQPAAGAPSQILARRKVGVNGDFARLRLSDFTRMAAVMTPPPVVNPNTGLVYLALYGAQVTGITSATQSAFPVMVLEINGTSLQVVRTLTYKPFTVRTPTGTYSEARNPPRYLLMPPDWSAVYTFGMVPSAYDSGTEGALSWSSLPAFVHNGTNYIQNIVSASGIRAASTASGWTFENARPYWPPGTNRVLLAGYDKRSGNFPGMLEGSLSPVTGFTPVRTLSNLGAILGAVNNRLYTTNIGNIGSVPLGQLDAPLTYHRSLPSIQFVEDGRQRQVTFNVAGAASSNNTGKLLLAGSDGVFVYDVASNGGAVDASMIQHPVTSGTTRTSKFIRSVLSGTVANKVVLRIDTYTSPVGGGIAAVSTQYMTYGY